MLFKVLHSSVLTTHTTHAALIHGGVGCRGLTTRWWTAGKHWLDFVPDLYASCTHLSPHIRIAPQHTDVRSPLNSSTQQTNDSTTSSMSATSAGAAAAAAAAVSTSDDAPDLLPPPAKKPAPFAPTAFFVLAGDAPSGHARNHRVIHPW